MKLMKEGMVEYQADGPIARVTFANVDKRNAMTIGMWGQLAEAVVSASSDPGVRLVVLAGAGGRAFVSGSDISGFAKTRSTPEDKTFYDRQVEAGLSALAECRKPTVAAIQGPCIGGGVSIAAACDLRVADETASFSVPAAKLGVGYSRAQIERLQQIVGPAVLREMIFTARRYSAAEALQVGLVSRLAPADDFAAQLDGLVGQIAGNAPLTIAAAKRASIDALRIDGERDPARTDAVTAACFASEDYREGQAAFAEKRPPKFMGR